jgi:hypothetical protein
MPANAFLPLAQGAFKEITGPLTLKWIALRLRVLQALQCNRDLQRIRVRRNAFDKIRLAQLDSFGALPLPSVLPHGVSL